MKTIVSLSVALLLSAFSVAPANAWSVKGYVRCPSGFPYPNVGIEVTGKTCEGMFDVTIATDAQGNYAIGLPDCAGSYKACILTGTLPPGSTLLSPECQDFTTDDNNQDADVVWLVNSSLCGGQSCANGQVGPINLTGLADKLLFFFGNGSQDANWQGATKGFAGDVVVDGILAKERTSGGVPYAGTIFTNDSTLSAWQHIVDQNSGQAFASFGNTGLVSTNKATLVAAIQTVNAMTATPGFTNRSAASLDGLNTQNGMAETIVINVTSGFQVHSHINITGDANDVFILRWDSDANPSNGYQGQVKFQSGGAIVPHGGLTAGNFIHVAGDMTASGGGGNPPSPYPQGPRLSNGTGPLIHGGSNWGGGGFFTGYWLTTGAPTTLDQSSGLYIGATSSFSNAIFVGGWYTCTTKFSMTSGTSGAYVSPNCP